MRIGIWDLKRNGLIGYIFIISICTLLPSCMRYEDISFKGIENLKMGKIGMNETTMEMDLIFNNPNGMGATLNNAQGKAWIQDIHVGDFLLNQDVKIPAKSNFSVPVRMSVNVKDLIKNSLTLMLKDSVNIKVDGDAKLSKGSIMKSFPLKYNGKKSTDELLKSLR